MAGKSHELAGLVELLDGRSRHFQLESGHHGELWLDLDAFLLRPALLSPYVEALARRLAETVAPEGICGPLVGGALIASAVATALDCELYVAEPAPPAGPSACPLCAAGEPLEDLRRG
jgi:orotate phosphoribosyltransferase